MESAVVSGGKPFRILLDRVLRPLRKPSLYIPTLSAPPLFKLLLNGRDRHTFLKTWFKIF
jgi:hypothetical protein